MLGTVKRSPRLSLARIGRVTAVVTSAITVAMLALESVAEIIRLAGEIGLAGASIEDATYRRDDPILARGLAIERIHAAVEAARDLPYPFTLTARSENFIRG